ncbi:hypothetical protein ANO11243_045930 [Dothideomycetidae sp. 11243]|nr:hypothetical protein ANO11243_045930 [fungal sp. No.11243]
MKTTASAAQSTTNTLSTKVSDKDLEKSSSSNHHESIRRGRRNSVESMHTIESRRSSKQDGSATHRRRSPSRALSDLPEETPGIRPAWPSRSPLRTEAGRLYEPVEDEDDIAVHGLFDGGPPHRLRRHSSSFSVVPVPMSLEAQPKETTVLSQAVLPAATRIIREQDKGGQDLKTSEQMAAEIPGARKARDGLSTKEEAQKSIPLAAPLEPHLRAYRQKIQQPSEDDAEMLNQSTLPISQPPGPSSSLFSSRPSHAVNTPKQTPNRPSGGSPPISGPASDKPQRVPLLLPGPNKTHHQNHILASTFYRITLVMLCLFLPPVAIILAFGCSKPCHLLITTFLWFTFIPLGILYAYIVVFLKPMFKLPETKHPSLAPTVVLPPVHTHKSQNQPNAQVIDPAWSAHVEHDLAKRAAHAQAVERWRAGERDVRMNRKLQRRYQRAYAAQRRRGQIPDVKVVEMKTGSVMG